MTNDSFTYKIHCEIGITSTEVEPDLITMELNIPPTRSFKKGEKTISKHSGSTITKPHHLWAIRSNSSQSEEETISPHIEFLKSIVGPQLEAFKRFKADPRFQVSFWVWIETDHAGIGFDLLEDELAFINAIANRIHFSMLTQE